MKYTLMLIIIGLSTLTACAQTKNDSQFLNLDFEHLESGEPSGWVTYGAGDYVISVDSTIAQNGKNSVSIDFNGSTSNFKAWALNFPANYYGKNIKLTGYIKTENVRDGYAGLWMRIDPGVDFDNMNDRGTTGTTDWKQYEINLNLQSSATNIVVGGMLVGKGKMWLDNLDITIDGKSLDQVPPRKETKADKDKEFDEGSEIPIITLDEKSEHDLYQLGLIWGFLKYYHPAIAKGDLNWDYELFRILPQVLSVKDNSERDKLLTDWIRNLGACEPMEMKALETDVKLSPDLNWISNSGFSASLVTELEKVRDAKRDGDHYYVSFVAGVGNPKFNEDAYAGMNYPDAGFRILTLYRYWNIIQYYFPYKNLIEEDWKGVLEEFITKFNSAENELEYKLISLELIARVHDTHANIWGNDNALNKEWGLNYAPIELAFIEDKAVVIGYFNDKSGKETGLQVGDIIETVNNESVSEIVKRQLKYTAASNYPTQLRDLAKKLLRTNASSIEVGFVRDKDIENKTINTYPPGELDIYKQNQEKDSCFKLINDKIAYLTNGTCKKEHLPILWEEIKNTRGLIIDIRNYPSDFIIYDLSSYLIGESIPFVKFSVGSTITPRLFTFGNTLNAGKENGEYYKGKVVILVNEASQSSAEFHSMAYRVHPNARVIGSTTAGADGNVSGFNLPGNIRTMISGIGVYYPDGAETQRIGIVPDIVCTPTIESVKQNRDLLMEKAIEIINHGQLHEQ